MPSAYSDNLRLELQATGENTGTWGTKANTTFSLLGDAVAGIQDITMIDANYTLNTNNGSDDEARAMVLNVIGATTTVRDIILPAFSKIYIVFNNLASGTNDIRINIGSTFVNIPFGFHKWVWTDGTSCYDATNKITERYQDWSGSLSTTGSPDAYLLTTNLVLTSYADGQKVHCVANFTNTGTATINIDSVGVKNLRKVDTSGDVALVNNEIVSAGHYILQYDESADSASGAWIVLNPTNPFDASNVAITGGSITGITDLTIPDGGTGSSTASDARTALGVAIGSDVQAHSDGLDDLNTVGAVGANSEFLVGTAAGVLDWENPATARTSLGLGTWATENLGQETLFMPGGGMTPRETTAPAAINTVEISNSLIPLTTMDFATDADDFCGFPVWLPKSWDAGVIVCQLQWSTDGSQTGGLDGVKWFARGGCYADDTLLTTTLGTAVGPAAQNHSGTAEDIKITAEFSITLANAVAERWAWIEIQRDVSDGGDDLDIDARLHGFRGHYTIDVGNDD